jgi:divalent metal cation (Fe/Co/Zn/Cd) transporter
MHLYLRLLRDETEEEYSDAERQHLRDLLIAAPGVQRVKGIKRHPRGGYEVTLDVNRESLKSLFEYIPAQGLMACL